MTIHIKNLRLRTIIGIQDWERKVQQDVIINIKLDYDGKKAAETDDIADTVDYKVLKRKVIDLVENSRYFLIDRLVHEIAALMMEEPFGASNGVLAEDSPIRCPSLARRKKIL